MNNTASHAAQLRALLAAIERQATDLVSGTVDTTDRAAVASAAHDVASLAALASERAAYITDALLERL